MRWVIVVGLVGFVGLLGCGSDADGGGAGGGNGGSGGSGAGGGSTGGGGGLGSAGYGGGGSGGSFGSGGLGSAGSGSGGSAGAAGRIVLEVSFDEAATGPYARDTLDAAWRWVRWAQGLSDGRVDIVEGAEAHSGKSLRVLYPQGSVGPGEGGAQWLVELPESFDELYVSYWVKFGDGFDFVKGGKIPGLGGGANNTGGNQPNGTDGWSGRMMWRVAGDAVQYLYHPDQPTIYGEDLPYDLGGQRSFVPGQWVQVEHHFVMNTPGQHDGVVEAWWNGTKALERRDIRFRDVDSFAVDVFYFSTFFGGSGADWAATKDEYAYFDDFVISTGPITH